MSDELRAAAIAVLRDAYPRQSFPDGSVAFYTRKLRDIDSVELAAAVDRLTNRCSFLPSVAEIRLEVADARLGLPTVTEAWEIAERGDLRNAPAPVREAAEYVGGRYAILRADRPAIIRAQFREQYDRLREAALLVEAGALVARRLPAATEQPALPAVDYGTRLMPRPVMARAARELAGKPLDPPTEEEMLDAVRVLRDGPLTDDPAEDSLYKAAELIFVQADNAMNEETTT